MTNLENLLTLNAIPELGSIRIKRLLDYFGSAQKIFSASTYELQRVQGMRPNIAQNIKFKKNKFDIKKELEKAKKNGIKIIALGDKEYPENLKSIYDPPIILYVKGNFEEKDNLAIAIVGSRRASIYGLTCAEKFAAELADLNITVVSGMARGVDSASHRGALKAKSRTIAVLGSGLLNIYPPENKKLFEEISEFGTVISEFPLDTKPFAGNFPKRNRIISGLSLGVIVVEASRNSGALITADLALEQGREVFAVPGKLDSVNSFGVNALIKQGAKLITSVDDVISELGPRFNHLLNASQKSEKPSEKTLTKPNFNLNEEEAALFELLQKDSKQIDELVQESHLPVANVLSTLMSLELKHAIKQLPGKIFVRNYV